MQTASGKAARRRLRVRRAPRPATILIGAIITVLAIGVMALALYAYSSGIWPAKVLSPGSNAPFTPTSPNALGLTVEKAGQPQQDPNNPNQLIVPVRITNKVVQSAAPQGTPTPNAATPTAGPAKVYNATVKVIFYDSSGNVVGGAVGNYANTQGGLPYGQSATFDVVAVGVSNYQSYQIFADNVWTDKDPVKGPGGYNMGGAPAALLGSNP